MKSIKAVPVSVWEALKPWMNQKKSLFKKAPASNKYFVKYIDLEDGVQFYFEINDFRIEGSRILFIINYSPASEFVNTPATAEVTPKDLQIFFDNWVALLNRYAKVPEFIEDEFILKYEEDFYAEFELVDDPEGDLPYDLKRQVWIDGYLGKVVKLLENDITHRDDPAVIEIIKDAKELQNEQTVLPRSTVIKKLFKIWAKTRKVSIKLLLLIRDEAIKEGVKYVVKGGLDHTRLLDVFN